MPRDWSQLDGVAVLLFLLGAILVVASRDLQNNNLGWVLIVIGIVKQMKEWT